MKFAISSNTVAATTQAGRINFQFIRTFEFDAGHKNFQKRPRTRPFFRKPSAMAHHQVRFDLAHRVQQDADRDCKMLDAAEKLSDVLVNAHLA